MSGGITDKLRGSLESYLARSAAELDERGAALDDRSRELTERETSLEQAELELEERERALEELGPLPARLTQALDLSLIHI